MQSQRFYQTLGNLSPHSHCNRRNRRNLLNSQNRRKSRSLHSLPSSPSLRSLRNSLILSNRNPPKRKCNMPVLHNAANLS
jgi:hypothetical protein